MYLEVNDLVNLGDGVPRLIVSKVHYQDDEYLMLITESEDQKIVKVTEEGLVELRLDELDIKLVTKLISVMKFNLDYNIDKDGTLKK